MKTILDSVKIPLRSDAKMNKGVYNCVECDFMAKTALVPYIIGIAPNTNWGTMVVWECPKCFQEQFFHYRTQAGVIDFQAGYVAYKLTGNSDVALEASLHFSNKEYTEEDIQNYCRKF